MIGDPVMARMLLAEKEEEVEAELTVAFPGLQMVNAEGGIVDFIAASLALAVVVITSLLLLFSVYFS